MAYSKPAPPDAFIRDCAYLGRGLLWLAGVLERYEDVDEDWEWYRTQSKPTSPQGQRNVRSPTSKKSSPRFSGWRKSPTGYRIIRWFGRSKRPFSCAANPSVRLKRRQNITSSVAIEDAALGCVVGAALRAYEKCGCASNLSRKSSFADATVFQTPRANRSGDAHRTESGKGRGPRIPSRRQVVNSVKDRSRAHFTIWPIGSGSDKTGFAQTPAKDSVQGITSRKSRRGLTPMPCTSRPSTGKHERKNANGRERTRTAKTSPEKETKIGFFGFGGKRPHILTFSCFCK